MNIFKECTWVEKTFLLQMVLKYLGGTHIKAVSWYIVGA